MAKTFNVQYQLRRDNDYNYARVANTFIPLKGEPCLVDTARQGLRVKIGDGVTPFGELEYVDTYLIMGYYINGAFYEDLNKNKVYIPSFNRIYVDKLTYSLFYYDGAAYQQASAYVRAASSEAAGILRLYNTTGSNEDGTMTQKAITDELNTKVELTLHEEEELVIFSLD